MLEILNIDDREEFLVHDTEDLLRHISMESDVVSLEGFLGDLTMRVSDGLTGSVTSVRKSMSSLMPFIYNPTSELKKQSEKVSFMDMDKLIVSTPESFRGYIGDYGKTLTDITARSKKALPKTLEAHKAKLARLLSSGDFEVNIHYSKDFKSNLITMNKDKAAFNSYYKKNSGSQKAKVPDIYGNWDEIIELNALLSNKKAKHVVSKEELDNILKSVEEVNEILIRVRDEMRSGNSKKRTRTLKDIANGVYTLAQEVDFFSTMVFEMKVLSEVTKQNEERILNFKGE